MILVDFSSIVHRKIFTAIKSVNPSKDENNKFITSEFIHIAKYFILTELFQIQQEFSQEFGDIVLCLDNAKTGYWRRDVFAGYKNKRKSGRDESEINYQEVFGEIDLLTEELKLNVPWKVVDIPKAEADDIMLVLAKHYSNDEKILIHSPDKDMIQAQRGNNNVKQYSSLTKKWIIPENKHDNMESWLIEHVVLGDACDGVPKVVEHCEFSESFIEYLKNNNIDEKYHTPFNFKYGYEENDEIQHLDKDTKIFLLEDFNIYKTNKKGESTGEKDIYADVKFGPVKLKKTVEMHGSLDKFLESHPLYKIHYDRNFTLVMEEGIPEVIRKEILMEFKACPTRYNNIEFEEYLKDNNLSQLILNLPSYFKIDTYKDLTAADFGW